MFGFGHARTSIAQNRAKGNEEFFDGKIYVAKGRVQPCAGRGIVLNSTPFIFSKPDMNTMRTSTPRRTSRGTDTAAKGNPGVDAPPCGTALKARNT